MSLHAAAWAKATTHSPAGEPITRSEKLLLMVLADYANPDTGVAWPSMTRLAREALMSERHARNLTQALEAKGLLVIERVRKEDGSNASNRYRFPALAPESSLSVAPSTSVVTPITAAELGEELVGPGGLLEGYMLDYPDSLATAYQATLEAAELIAVENANVSDNLAGYLRNRVIAHAATDLGEMEGKQLARLYREAKALGEHGGRWIVKAILHTASADVEGNLASYVIATARRMKQEAAGR